MKYPIIGIILSVAAATAGIIYDINALLIGGIVFFLCSVGTVIGIRLRHKYDVVTLHERTNTHETY